MSARGSLEPLRRDSTAERVAARLRESILLGGFTPSQSIREVEVARQLGVSRGPVREAFQRLIQEGLLEAHAARGVFVAQLSAEDVEDLYFARQVLETAAARTLATSRAPAYIKDLQAALDALEAAAKDDWAELARLDLKLHEVLVRSSGNKRLVRMFQTLSAESRLCMVALEPFYPDHGEMVVEHAEIVHAISVGDAELAVQLVERHMGDSVERLVGHLKIRPDTS